MAYRSGQQHHLRDAAAAGSNLSQYFEVTAFSAEVGSAKPGAAIYLAACKGLGVDPAECVYVADGSDNELPGAVSLGMYAVRTTEDANSDPARA
jgi:putative hydrolase of the HAD superfamily